MERAVTVLPEADSPTSAILARIERERGVVHNPARAEVDAEVLLRAGSRFVLFNTSWIESIPQRISDQDEKKQGHYEHGKGGGDPPRVEVVLALVGSSPGSASRRHAESEEVEAGERADRGGHFEGNERDHGRQAVRQDVAPDDGPVALAKRARRARSPGSVAQELGAHVRRDAEPAEDGEQHDQQAEAARTATRR